MVTIRESPLSKLNELVEEHVIHQISQQIILAIDEADRLLHAPFRNDFFGLMRTWHNNRSIEEQWNKINLILIISTEPGALISSLYQSPFNVGVNIYLEDFNRDQVYRLNRLHGSPVNDNAFEAFFELLEGHPYLTREALYLLVSERWTFQKLMRDAAKDQGPFGSHFMSQFNVFTKDHDLQKAFTLINQQNKCNDEESVSRLLQLGLVKGRGDSYYCRCGLYRQYFEGRFR